MDSGMPTDRSSLQELERGVGVLARRENPVALYQRIAAQAGLNGARPGACCLLSRIGDQPGVSLTEPAEQIGIPASDLAPRVSSSVAA
jgi:hypothetical protein